jgi:putative cell wall-binding protein
MRRNIRIASGALALTIAASTFLSGPVATAAVTTAATLAVQGNTLVDTRTNTVFVPRGVNWPGFEYSCWQGWEQLPAANEADAIAAWGISVVRLPLNQDCWLGLQGSPSGQTVAHYKAAVASWVSALNSVGVVVILDLHSSAPLGYPAHGQRAMPDSQSLSFWTSVATAYASNHSVMFDLFNEPYSRGSFQLTWDCWKNGGCLAPVEDDYTAALSGAKYTVVGMAALVSAIRATGATQPLMLGGLNYSNDLTGWLANRPSDTQLVASWHNYPGQGCSDVACWTAQVLPVAAVVPVVTGEFGNTAETTTATGSHNYLVPFMTWADAHGIGYLPWAWWQVDASESPSNSIYALTTGPNFTPKAPSGTKFHDHLQALATSAITVTRIGGSDRYAASAGITAASFPGTSSVVYIATGGNFPDALSAAPAAAKQNAPLLLVEPTRIPTLVEAEIRRLQPSLIVVAGGSGSVSDAVYARLATMTTTIRRDTGLDRYEASRAVTASAFSPGDSTLAYIATGANFPDALSASSAASSVGAPVILVNGSLSALDAATLSLLSTLGISRISIAGGPASVSVGIENQLRALPSMTSVRRFGGADRFAVSGALNRDAFATSTTAYLASGMNFPDALSGAPVAGARHAPLYVIPPACLPANVLQDFHSFGVTQVVILGGPGSLLPAVESLAVCP